MVGAVHSGVSAVVFAMILLRWAYGWQDYIRHEHIDALGRLLIVVATGWFYFLVMEIIFGIYGLEGDELAVRALQFLPGDHGVAYNIWMIVFVGITYFLPVILWLPRRGGATCGSCRRRVSRVNVGMWLERYLLFVARPGQQAVPDLHVERLPAAMAGGADRGRDVRLRLHADAALQPGVPSAGCSRWCRCTTSRKGTF